MTTFEMSDSENHVFFAEGFVKDLKRISAYVSKGFEGTDMLLKASNHRFKENETAIAWTLSAYARQMLGRRSYDWKVEGRWNGAMRIPIDTWILGYPKSEDAHLSSWYDGLPSDTNYRLMIHRAENHYRDLDSETLVAYGEADNVWRAVYSNGLPNKKILNVRRKGRRIKPELKNITAPFLERLLEASKSSKEEVTELFGSCGHEYWHSSSIMADLGHGQWIATWRTDE